MGVNGAGNADTAFNDGSGCADVGRPTTPAVRLLPRALAACTENDPNADPGRLPPNSESVDVRMVSMDGVGGGSGTGPASMLSSANCCCNANACGVEEWGKVRNAWEKETMHTQ